MNVFNHAPVFAMKGPCPCDDALYGRFAFFQEIYL